MQDEIEGLRDMISKNIQAVYAMLGIRNSTRSSSVDLSSGKEDDQPRKRSSSFTSSDLGDLENPFLPKCPSPKTEGWYPCPAVKTVPFSPIFDFEQPAPVFPLQ